MTAISQVLRVSGKALAEASGQMVMGTAKTTEVGARTFNLTVDILNRALKAVQGSLDVIDKAGKWVKCTLITGVDAIRKMKCNFTKYAKQKYNKIRAYLSHKKYQLAGKRYACGAHNRGLLTRALTLGRGR